MNEIATAFDIIGPFAPVAPAEKARESLTQAYTNKYGGGLDVPLFFRLPRHEIDRYRERGIAMVSLGLGMIPLPIPEDSSSSRAVIDLDRLPPLSSEGRSYLLDSWQQAAWMRFAPDCIRILISSGRHSPRRRYSVTLNDPWHILKQKPNIPEGLVLDVSYPRKRANKEIPYIVKLTALLSAKE